MGLDGVGIGLALVGLLALLVVPLATSAWYGVRVHRRWKAVQARLGPPLKGDPGFGPNPSATWEGMRRSWATYGVAGREVTVALHAREGGGDVVPVSPIVFQAYTVTVPCDPGFIKLDGVFPGSTWPDRLVRPRRKHGTFHETVPLPDGAKGRVCTNHPPTFEAAEARRALAVLVGLGKRSRVWTEDDRLVAFESYQELSAGEVRQAMEAVAALANAVEDSRWSPA